MPVHSPTTANDDVGNFAPGSFHLSFFAMPDGNDMYTPDHCAPCEPTWTGLVEYDAHRPQDAVPVNMTALNGTLYLEYSQVHPRQAEIKVNNCELEYMVSSGPYAWLAPEACSVTDCGDGDTSVALSLAIGFTLLGLCLLCILVFVSYRLGQMLRMPRLAAGRTDIIYGPSSDLQQPNAFSEDDYDGGGAIRHKPGPVQLL